MISRNKLPFVDIAHGRTQGGFGGAFEPLPAIDYTLVPPARVAAQVL